MITASLFAQSQEQGNLYVYVQDQSAIPAFSVDNGKTEIIIQNSGLKSILESYEVYSFDRAFPAIDAIIASNTYELERVYVLKCHGDETQLMNILSSSYSEYYDFIEVAPVTEFLYTPNDYHLLDGIHGPNYALDIINAKQAWDITTGDEEIILGIPDSGFDLTHVDLQSEYELVYPGTINDWHGTFVSGIAAAATDNNTGMSSIGFDCKLAVMSFLTYSISAGLNGALQMANDGIKIINASWANPGYSITDHNAVRLITDLGSLIVCAAGNGTEGKGNGYHYPASHQETLSVTSIDSDYLHAHEVNNTYQIHTHNDLVDVSAPGYEVISTAPGNDYWKSSGTSYAAPYVTGLAGLMLSVNSNLTPHQIKHIIKSSTLDIDHLNEEYAGLIGTGLIDAYAAVLKAELFNTLTLSNFDIYGTETWNDTDTKLVDSYIHVHAGGNLTIKSSVLLNQNAKIIVEPGASLTLDGAYLTKLDGEYWSGIEVWGNPELDQVPQSNQGYLSISNKTIIEYAKCALTIGRRDNETLLKAYGGGIVEAENSRFEFNYKSVEFSDYSRSFPPFILPNLSHFDNIFFLGTSNIIYGNEEIENVHITLRGVDGIKIRGCSFKCEYKIGMEMDDPANGTGILSYSSSFFVEPFIGQSETIESSFINLHYGIKAFATNPQNSIWVENVNFFLNYRSIYANAFQNATLFGNNFDIMGFPGQSEFGYGIFLDNCTDYIVENNQLQKGHPTSVVLSIAGIIVNNSGPDYNLINNNNFHKLHTGILAQNHNRGYLDQPETGLVLKCNDFTQNYFDIAVTADEENPHNGIGKYQGTSGSPSSPAGNLFGHWRPASTSDYHNEEGHILYFHHSPSDPRLEPLYYTDATITLIDANEDFGSESCPLFIPAQKMELMAMQQDYEDQAASDKLLLEQLVDQGDTDEMEMMVNLSNPQLAYETYQALMSTNGLLSETVLEAAILKEDVLLDAFIRDIMVENAHSAKSGELMDLVEGRFNPLPEYMLAQIEEGFETVSPKEGLEAKLSMNSLIAATASNALVNLYKRDVQDQASFDSLTAYLESQHTPDLYYRLAYEYLAAGQIGNAEQAIQAISGFPLTASQIEMYNRMVPYFNLQKDMKVEGRHLCELSVEEIEFLIDLETGGDLIASYARSILIANGIFDYSEPIILPNDLFKSDRIKRIDTNTVPTEQLKLSPNPTSSYVLVAYNTGSSEMVDNSVLITDMTGRLVKTVHLGNKPIGKQLISLERMPKGVYVISLVSDTGLVANRKLTIQ